VSSGVSSRREATDDGGEVEGNSEDAGVEVRQKGARESVGEVLGGENLEGSRRGGGQLEEARRRRHGGRDEKKATGKMGCSLFSKE